MDVAEVVMIGGIATKFATPITDISDIGGGTAQGVFFYAYVDGPEVTSDFGGALTLVNNSHDFCVHTASASPANLAFSPSNLDV
jgi:hypothetical protein